MDELLWIAMIVSGVFSGGISLVAFALYWRSRLLKHIACVAISYLALVLLVLRQVWLRTYPASEPLSWVALVFLVVGNYGIWEITSLRLRERLAQRNGGKS